MTLSAQQPPDGWIMQTGVWNTDATATTSTSIGSSGLQIGGTATLTKMTGPWIPLNIDASLNVQYEASIVLFNLLGSINVTVSFVTYDITRSTGTPFTVFTGTVLGTAYKSVLVSSTTKPWGRFEISKTSTGTGTIAISSLNVTPVAPSFTSLLATTRVIPVTGSFTNVVMDGNKALSWAADSGAGTSIQILRSGAWFLSFSAYFSAVPAGKFVACRIVDNSGSAIALVPQGGPVYNGGAANGDLVVSCSGIAIIPSNALGSSTQDVITVQVVHSNSANLNLLGTIGAGVYATKFTGVQISA